MAGGADLMSSRVKSILAEKELCHLEKPRPASGGSFPPTDDPFTRTKMKKKTRARRDNDKGKRREIILD